jgi:RHH-type proline utilization regulon transcriptional repressor/proline dehydrogenase/delta 1-pyrroline-5-carboxylate dehydrogenase
MTRKAGEPLVRLAVRRAMKIIGGEFVVGRSIEEALARSARDPDVGLCSFDMLGEGARTSQDAERYLKSYQHAIQVIGAAAASSASPAGSTAPGAGAPRATAPGPAPHLLSSLSIKHWSLATTFCNARA